MLNIDIFLTESDHKTHRSFPFTVEPDQKKLHLEIYYSPKSMKNGDLLAEMINHEATYLSENERKKLKEQCSGQGRKLSNLLTFTLIGPRGIVGCAHRPASHQMIDMGENNTTPGFFPGKPEPGEWKLIVSACALYEKTEVKISIGEGVHE
jgi:hypothetical protein